jgi:hypothetical protein
MILVMVSSAVRHVVGRSGGRKAFAQAAALANLLIMKSLTLLMRREAMSTQIQSQSQETGIAILEYIVHQTLSKMAAQMILRQKSA